MRTKSLVAMLVLAGCGGAIPSPVAPVAGVELPPATVDPAAIEDVVALARPSVTLTPPPVHGNGLDAVTQWARNELAYWLEMRRALLVEAEHSLIARAQRSPELAPLTSALIAISYLDFARQVDASPIPTEIQQDAQLLRLYTDALAGASRPLYQRASEYFGRCQDATRDPAWQATCHARSNEAKGLAQSHAAQ